MPKLDQQTHAAGSPSNWILSSRHASAEQTQEPVTQEPVTSNTMHTWRPCGPRCPNLLRVNLPAEHLSAACKCAAAATDKSLSHLEHHAHVAAVRTAVLKLVQQPHASGGALWALRRVPGDRRQQLDLVLRRLSVMLCALLHL